MQLRHALLLLLAVAGVPGPAAAGAAGTCEKVVYCLDGMAHRHDDYNSSTGNSCEVECGGNCCTGGDLHTVGPCDGGRFAVCADTGDGSCAGHQVCAYVGENGSAGLISGGSCVGHYACNRLASQNGVVGDIAGGSCTGDVACAYAAMVGGVIGNITDGSCATRWACQHTARDGGVVGDIAGGSCVGDAACQHAGRNGGAVGDVSGSCQGNYACDDLGRGNGEFQVSLDACCNADNECKGVGCLYSSCPSPPPIIPATCPTPTKAPTSAPTAGSLSTAWDLQEDGIIVNFNSTENKSVSLKYLMGKGRDFRHSLTAGTCGDGAPVGEEVVLTTGIPTAIAGNATHDLLTVTHLFNLSQVSTIPGLFNITTSVLSFCQEVSLYFEPNGLNYLITKLLTQVFVTLNLTSGFSFGVQTEKATVGESDQNVMLDNVLNAFHCMGTGFGPVPAGTKLKPNDLLHICLQSQDTNFEIEKLNAMYVADGLKAGYPQLDIVSDGSASIEAITSLETPNATSRIVTTRLPVNVIDYESEGSIKIEGTATLKFRDGRRRLSIANGHPHRGLQAAPDEEEAGFGVSISLAPAEEVEGPLPAAGAVVVAATRAVFAAGVAALLLAL